MQLISGGKLCTGFFIIYYKDLKLRTLISYLVIDFLNDFSWKDKYLHTYECILMFLANDLGLRWYSASS